MATTIIDLDKLVPPTKRVKLANKTWTLPAEIPVPLYLRMKAAQATAAENPEAEQDVVEMVHDECLELFKVYHPDLEMLPVGIVQLFRVIPSIYPEMGGGTADEGDADPNPPRTAGRTGKRSTTARRRRTSAS